MSSSKSMVLRWMQEQRSREAKKAEATLAPTQLAIRSSFAQDRRFMQLSLLLLVVVAVSMVVLEIIDKATGFKIMMSVVWVSLMLYTRSFLDFVTFFFYLIFSIGFSPRILFSF